MLFSKIDTVTIRVGDVVAAQSWYEEKLQMRPNYFDDEQRIVVMESDSETTITLWEREPFDVPVPLGRRGTYPVLFTDQIEESHAVLIGRGVNAEAIEGEPGEPRWFGFTDPDGNYIEVATY